MVLGASDANGVAVERISRLRAIGWVLVGVLTLVAVAFALWGNLNAAMAATAVVIGVAAAVSIDAWHELHEAKSDRGALAKQIAEARAANRGELAEAVGKVAREQRNQTSQLEAMLQVLPRVAGGAVLPPSGGFAMDGRALAELSDVIGERVPRLVLELGSGTSTIWIAQHIAAAGGRIVSIDHDPKYGEATRAQVYRRGLDHVAEVRIAPLVELADDRRWYDASVFADLENIDLLVVDGPPGATCKNAREPALGALRAALSPGAVVVLDDVGRAEERDILATWLATWPEFERVDSGASSLAVLMMKQD
jgi:hypothetical protein